MQVTTEYYYDYEMGENSTQNVTDVSTFSTVQISTSQTSSPSGSQVPRDHSDDEGQFVINVMIAVAATICFIILVTATCFIYRSKKRARLNIRRARSRSRPGVLSLELLERDLIQSGLPHAANQPLYGIETAENTTISEVSSSAVREEFHNRSTRSKKPPVENGTPPNVEQSANHIRQEPERLEEKNRLMSESDKTCHTYQNINNTERNSQENTKEALERNSRETTKEALKPPVRKESEKKKIPPQVAKKPLAYMAKKREQITKSNSENEENETDKNSLKQRNISTTSSEYENPEAVINKQIQTDGIKIQISDVTVTQIGESKSGAKLPRPPLKSTKERGSENLCSNVKGEKNSEKKNSFVLDINITIPPPSPCSNKAGYVNTPCEIPDELFLPTGPKHGYVNIPNLSNSSKKDTKSENPKGQKASPRLRKAGSADPPGIGNNNEYVNLKKAMYKRGHSAPFLSVLSENKAGKDSSSSLTGIDLEHGYVRMGACEEDNVYIPMGVTKAQEAIYLDMSSGKYADLNAETDSTGCYVNADVSTSDSQKDTGYGYVNADVAANDSKKDKGYDYSKEDANANCFKQDHEYVNADTNGDRKDPRMCKGESHGYVNTDGEENNGYALPRAATYKVVGGTPRCATTGRSKSTDNIYDYAVLKGINANFKL